MQDTENRTEPSLQDLFREAWLSHQRLESDSDVADTFHAEVITSWKEVELLVNKLALFSSNETFDDVQTAYVRYLFVPYFMAEAEMKSRDITTRFHSLKRAEGCFTVFLMRLQRLEVLSQQDRNAFNQKEGSSVPASQLRTEMVSRAKEAEEQKKYIEGIGTTEILLGRIADEEQERELLKTMLSYYAFTALRELNLIRQEIPLLEMHMQRASTAPRSRKPQEAQGITPTKLTEREDLKRNVFRYVNPPTMTIEEAGEIEMRLMMQRQAESERRQQDKGTKGDKDEDEEDTAEGVKKKREWDDWKDENPRGWGNRMNQG